MFSLTKVNNKIILNDIKHDKKYQIDIDEIDYIVGDDNKLRNDSIIERFIELRENKDKPIKMVSKEADLKKEYKEAERKNISNVGMLIDKFIEKYNLSAYDLKILADIPDDVGIRKLKKNDIITRNMMYDLRDLKKKIKEEDQTIADSFNYMKSYLSSYNRTLSKTDKELLEFIRNPDNYEGIWKEKCDRYNDFIEVINSGCPRVGTIKLNIITRHRNFFEAVLNVKNDTKLDFWNNDKIDLIKGLFSPDTLNKNIYYGTDLTKESKYFCGVQISSNYITALFEKFDEFSREQIKNILTLEDKDFYIKYNNIMALGDITSTINLSSINTAYLGGFGSDITKKKTMTITNPTFNPIKENNKLFNKKHFYSYTVDETMKMHDLNEEKDTIQEQLSNLNDKMKKIEKKKIKTKEDKKTLEKQREEYDKLQKTLDEKKDNLKKLNKNDNVKNEEIYGQLYGINSIIGLSTAYKKSNGMGSDKFNPSASGWTDTTLTRIDNILETLRNSSGRLYMGRGPDFIQNNPGNLYCLNNRECSGWTDTTLTRIDNILETLKKCSGFKKGIRFNPSASGWTDTTLTRIDNIIETLKDY